MADSSGTDQSPQEVTKESIRKKVWSHIEAGDLANFPRPVTKRIPNFKGADEAAVKAAELDAFKKAHTVKINPDKPQQHTRYLTIEAGKTLLVPTPRLRTGLFNKIIPPEEQTKDVLRICSTSQGVREHSVPIGLDANIKIDLVIVGSVAVSSSGLRIGKGEGFADLEFAMMMTMGAIGRDTIVVSTIHDCQVKDDIPESIMGPHDLSVDFIVTPTRVIECKRKRLQPVGIIWSIITNEKLERVPILKKLRLKEFNAGKDVRLEGETEAPTREALEEEDRKVDEMAEKEANEPSPQRFRRNRYFRGRRTNRFRGRRRQTDGEEADGEKGSASESDTQKRPATRPRRPRRPRKRDTSRTEENGEKPGEQGETEGSGDEKGDRRRPYRKRWRRRQPMRSHSGGDGSGGEEKENEGDSNGAGDRRPPRERRERRPRPTKTSSLYVGNIPKDLRVSEFKAKVRGYNISPLQVIWHGNNAHAFLVFAAYEEVEHALTTLEGMEIMEKTLTVQLSKRTQTRQTGKGGAADTNDGQQLD